MKYNQALAVSDILGRCTIKGLGGLFLPIIKLKAQLSATCVAFGELQKEIFKEAGVEVNTDGSVPAGTSMTALNQATEAMNKLGDDITSVEGYQILSEDDLMKLGDENPTLSINEAEQLLVLLKSI